MLQFVFLAVLISVPVSNLSMEDARLGSFEEICKWFCTDANNYYFFRKFDDVFNPRIFCGLCQKKLSTATTTVTPSTSPTTGAPTTRPVTVTPTNGPTTTTTTVTPSTSSTTTTTIMP